MALSFSIENRIPTVLEYQQMRASTDWQLLTDEVVQQGLAGSLFSVCVLQEEHIAGIGRIVGDGAIYFYIQDVIVLPEFQKLGLGRMIMEEIMQYLERTAPHNAFIGLMASRGISEFYEKLGFQRRPASGPGMYLIKS